MLTNNKSWLQTQVTRMFLEGYSQERIAQELNLSEGSVSAIMQELKQSDDTLSLQHEIAVVCNKHGISIAELASNLAFSNALRKKAFENNKIDTLLEVLNAKFNGDGSHSPDAAADMILQICDLLVKNHTDINTLYSQIEEKLNHISRLERRINETRAALTGVQMEIEKAFDEKNMTLRKLHNYGKCREAFEAAGVDFSNWHETVNLLRSLKLMDYNADKIINKLKKIESLEANEMHLLSSCQEKRMVLEQLKKKEEQEIKYWNAYYWALKEFVKLKLMGLSPYTMLRVFEVINNHRLYLSLDELISDIDTYGGIKSAIFKEKIDLQQFIKSKESLGIRENNMSYDNKYDNFLK